MNNNFSFRGRWEVIVLSLISLVLCIAVTYLLLKPADIAYIDSAKLLQEFSGAKKAHAEFEGKAAKWQANIDTLKSELESVKKAGLTENELAKKHRQLEDYQNAIRQNAAQEEQKLTQGVIDNVNGFLREYGKKHRYRLILIANGTGNIAYAAEGLDITDEVLKELNEKFN